MCDVVISAETNEKPSNRYFSLHNHDDYEIYLFLEGDTEYIVEGRTYSLEPHDMIIIRKHEMHRAFHRSNAKYKRIVINLSPEFFKTHHCEGYEEQFLSTDAANKIDSETVMASGIYDAIVRLGEYSSNYTDLSNPVSQSVLVEILYLINSIRRFSGADDKRGQLGEIINYINNHFTENITLDMLQKRFFISKYHICYIFRKGTGMTVHQYITRKRITLARELEREGRSISEASSMAGFNSYSSFYRAYVKEYGNSPKNKTYSHHIGVQDTQKNRP